MQDTGESSITEEEASRMLSSILGNHSGKVTK
jgi:hypothetical protein